MNIYKSRIIIESDINIMYWLYQIVYFKVVFVDNYVYIRNGGFVVGFESGYRGDVICMI